MRNLFITTLMVVSLMCFVGVNASAKAIEEKDAQKASANTKNFSDNIGKQWVLTNVNINGKDTGFSREELTGFHNGDELFTLKFDSELLFGTAAPNRYSGPYTIDNQTIKIPPMRSTQMAALFEPENLKEHNFYVYLQGAYKWESLERRLDIYSKTGNDEVVMTFINSD